MTVDEEARHHVYEAFKTSHGPDIAGALMQMLPPAGVPELATKADIAVQRAEFEGLRAEFRGLRGDFRALEADVGAMEARMGERLERALNEQANRFIGWLVGVAGVTLAAAGLIAGLVAGLT